MRFRDALCLCLLALVYPENVVCLDWDAYEQGAMGIQPRVKFQTTTYAAPLIHVPVLGKECRNEDEFVFMTPRAHRDSSNKAIFLDYNGQLVWWRQERGAVSNMRPQTYKGQGFLTYWVGDDDNSGHGTGYYKMLDQKYRLAYAVKACNNNSGDYHEFSITRDDTALITSYERVSKDLSRFGKADGYIWDCVFQEIDIETNDLLFEWRASEHFSFADMAVSSWTEYTGTEINPWDWFHINSVEKDNLGNYLIAARYTNAVTYINGKTGKILWNLGGKVNNFKDKSGGGATRLIDPQMARRNHNGRGITLFDNVAYWSIDTAQKISRGLEIYVNAQTLEARVSKEFIHPGKLFGLSDGSMQLLENGHYFIGYGSLPVYAEFSAKGKLLCEAHYSPLNATRGLNSQGGLRTYRTYKYPWIGQPDTLPSLAIRRDRIFVSWNGASLVGAWQLSASSEARWRASSSIFIGTFKKTGFETRMDIPDAGYSSFKLTALESDGTILGQWSVHNDETLTELVSTVGGLDRPTSSNSFAWLVILCLWMFILFYFMKKLLFRWKKLRI